MVGDFGFIAELVVGGEHGKLPLIRIPQTNRHEYERLIGGFNVADSVEELGGREKKKGGGERRRRVGGGKERREKTEGEAKGREIGRNCRM